MRSRSFPKLPKSNARRLSSCPTCGAGFDPLMQKAGCPHEILAWHEAHFNLNRYYGHNRWQNYRTEEHAA